MQPYNIQIDPALAQEAQAVFSDLGMNLSAAVTVFLRQTVKQHAIPFHVDKNAFTDEELAEAHQRGMAQIKAGHCVHVSMADLEKMANE